jgi:hypothetical protein
MSVDNGVYVLQTKGPEFRVAYAHSIGNIYGKFDYETVEWTGDMDRMIDYFGQSVVYTDIDDAMDAAELLADKYPYLEDGICLISCFSNLKFGSINEVR